MDGYSPGNGSSDSPEGILDALRNDRESNEEARDAQLSRLVERFPVHRLRDAIRDRLGALGGNDGEAILRLVEAYATPELLGELADALEAQPDLPPERAWGALALLDGAGVLEDRPELADRWEELNETFEEDDPLSTLVDQLEEEPDGSWVALQGLGAVEPEVRAEILEGLADYPSGPGLVAFLRILAFAHDPATREAALDVLTSREDLEHRHAWAEIAHDHPEPDVRDLARRQLAPIADESIAEALIRPERARPESIGNLVTALDGSGRGTIVLASRDRGRWVVASFECDVWRGVVEVSGQVGEDPAFASNLFEELSSKGDRDVIEDAPGLASGLLAGCLTLCGPKTSPALRYWIERTAGPEFRARPVGALFEDDDIAPHSTGEMAVPVREILDACPGWVDASGLTYDIAEEIALRSGLAPPDPRRDAGAYRYLFEHRLVDRLEHYSRMLLWMASFWRASGDLEHSKSALTLAWQLSDPQHAVPSHPFATELSTRSLAAAQAALRAGIDPRKKK